MLGKAVVLARGLGTRMQKAEPGVNLSEREAELAGRGLKALIPLNGRPFLDYLVDSLLGAGLSHICLVVAPEAELMRQNAERISRLAGVSVTCAVQPEPKGTADAVLAAEQFAGQDSFLLVNGDNLFEPDTLRKLARARPPGCAVGAFPREELVRLGNFDPERVKGFAVVDAAEDGRLVGVVEKPSDPDRYARQGRVLVGMNLYRFTPSVFAACRGVEPDPERGELELTAAVEALADGPEPFRVVICKGRVLDLTGRADIPQVEQALADWRISF
ncbi:MAG: nucleotidyltransferase family protein [Candidatus Brocadiia bacterium]